MELERVSIGVLFRFHHELNFFIWRLKQMRHGSTNNSKPNLERMRWGLNKCCITKILRWGAREGGEATAIYTRQVCKRTPN